MTVLDLDRKLRQLSERVGDECKYIRLLVNQNKKDLSALETTDKSSLVAAINEIVTVQGLKTDLSIEANDDNSITIASSTGDNVDLNAATQLLAGLFSANDKIKLDNIEIGATNNSPDSFLLDRVNHTGTQLSSTISDFTSSVDARIILIIDDSSPSSSTVYSSDKIHSFFDNSEPISGYNKTNWDTAFGWGDHSVQGYLTSYTETDPVFTASDAASITASNIADWNTAFGWGNHATQGYLTSFTETDPVFLASDSASITAANITNWNTAFSWGNHSSAGYLTSETDPVFTASQAFNITATDITNLSNLSGVNTGDQDLSPYQLISEKGAANGYVPLNASSLIDSSYLPSYVDDVLEYADFASFPVTGETGKIYIDLSTNDMYRWSGAIYVQVGGTLPTAWGTITGTLSNQTDLQTALDGKSNTGHTHTFSDITDLASFTGFDARYYTETEIGEFFDGTTPITGYNKSNWDTAFGWGDHAGNYVQLSGDSMTGPLDIGGSIAVGRQLTLLGTGDANANAAGGLLLQTTAGGGFDIFATSTAANPTWDIRTFANEPISISAGSVLNATFNANGTTDFADGITVGGNTVWHAGNDGSGSGLNADLLDGVDSSRVWYGSNERKSLDGRGILDSITASGVYFDNNTSPSPNNGLVLHMQYDINDTIASQIGANRANNTWRVRVKDTDDIWTNWSTIWTNSNDDSLVKKTTSINSTTGAFDIGAGSSTGDIGYTLFSNVNPGGTLPSNYSGIFTFYGDSDGRNFALYKNNDATTTNSFYVGLAASDGTLTWQEIWHSGNDGAGSGLDADLLDGVSWGNVNTSIVTTGNLQYGNVINSPSQSTRDKIRVYSAASYTIGMQLGISFGALTSDWGMTFQMNDDNDRGFWWGDDGHSTSQGAMSLSTNGYLTLANHMRVGYGESDTTAVSTTYTIQANGTMQASNFILSSDRRLKKNIKKYTPKPIKIQWKEFDWKDKEKGHQLGLIAQEVQKNHPEFVIKDDQGLLSVKYTEVLIAKMAEKDAQIEELSGKIERLEFILKNML